MVLVKCALRLRAILHHLEPVLTRNGHQRIKINALTVQMNGNDGGGARRNRRLDLLDIHQEVVVTHAEKDRLCAQGADRRNRRHRVLGTVMTSSPAFTPNAASAM